MDEKAQRVFGRPSKLMPHQRREAIARRDAGEETLTDIARSYNVSHSTINRLRSTSLGGSSNLGRGVFSGRAAGQALRSVAPDDEETPHFAHGRSIFEALDREARRARDSGA
jgi:hypothetical protein